MPYKKEYDLINMFQWIKGRLTPFSPYEFEKEWGLSRNASKPWFAYNPNVFHAYPGPNGTMRYALIAGLTLEDFIAAVANRRTRAVPLIDKIVTNEVGTFDFSVATPPPGINAAMNSIANNNEPLMKLLTNAQVAATHPVHSWNNKDAVEFIQLLGECYPVASLIAQLAVKYCTDPDLFETHPDIPKMVLAK